MNNEEKYMSLVVLLIVSTINIIKVVIILFDISNGGEQVCATPLFTHVVSFKNKTGYWYFYVSAYLTFKHTTTINNYTP